MNVSDLFIKENISIREVIKKLNKTAKKILLITEDKVLKGVVTDGDIRRWILNNGNLDIDVKKIMNYNPISLVLGEESKATDIMKNKKINAIPIVNDNNEVVDIIFGEDLFQLKRQPYEEINTPVVIMAGGEGKRLYPLTKVFPKPLVPVGDIPIVERIINRFVDFGCKEFYLTINYKKNLIKSYFDDLEKTYNLEYVEEEKPLGTAGSLYFLKDKINGSFFVSNCDILIDDNYYNMLHYHKENKNKITVVAAIKLLTVAYGVIELDEERIIKEIIEKPQYNFLVNTGLYILEPETLYDIPENKFYHITDLIRKYVRENKRVGVYPINEESWLDMGQFKEMGIMIKRLGLN